MSGRKKITQKPTTDQESFEELAGGLADLLGISGLDLDANLELVGGAEAFPEDLYEALDQTAVFLDSNVEALASEALGVEVSAADPRLETLAMAVTAFQFLNEMLESDEYRPLLKGGAREKVTFTAELLASLVQAGVTDLASGDLEGVAWEGPDDGSLVAFSSLTLAAGHLNVMLLGTDLARSLQGLVGEGDPDD